MDEVFLLVRNNGYEGHEKPFRAYAKQAQAEAVKALLDEAGAPGEWLVVVLPVEPAA